MPGNAVARADDPLEGLRTVHLIEEAIVQKGLRQLRGLLRGREERGVVDELAAAAIGSMAELEDILVLWAESRGAAPRPVVGVLVPPERSEVLRSFIDIKESEAAVLRRSAAAAPDDLRDRLLALAHEAEAQAARLERLRD